MAPPSTIRVAISGGGVAGALLLHALLPLQHIDAHIFESAPQFREAGVAFGLGRNATNALDFIGPSARACLQRAGGVQMKGSACYVAQGEEAGEKVVQIDDSTTVVQRANLLHELLEGTPPERMHVSKKLTSVEHKNDGSLLVHFADGSTHECDLLIGADGVHSTVRKIVLGENDPAATPRQTGQWAIMTLNPYEEARASIGVSPINIEDAREYAWSGNGSFMMNNILSHGDIVQFAILSGEELPLSVPEETTNRWTRTVKAETLKDMYLNKGWMPHLDSAVSDILCKEPTRQAIYLWEHPHAKTFVSGPICLLGDAAHATTPFMGSGGGMCVEDTLIMSALLARVSSPAEAIKALKVYDEVRRPRTQHVVEASKRTGDLITGSDLTVGLDAKKLREILAGRWDFIMDFDNARHRDEAMELLEAELMKKISS